MPLFSLTVAGISAVILVIAIQRSKAGQFYHDTPWLWPLGIFVWGDGLVLAPFWLVAAGLFWFLTPLQGTRLVLLFWAIRSGYEVIYWLNHQFADKKYRAPLFRHITWLTDDQSAILYQVLNMAVMILVLGLLLISYS